jgi:hypothetical protein
LGGAQIVIINLPGFEESLPELSSRTSLPILQDTDTEGVAKCFGASKWYVYVMNRSGVPRFIHYQIDLAGERNRLFLEIATLNGAGSK